MRLKIKFIIFYSGVYSLIIFALSFLLEILNFPEVLKSPLPYFIVIGSIIIFCYLPIRLMNEEPKFGIWLSFFMAIMGILISSNDLYLALSGIRI